uniref:Cysteine-rich peptide 2 n=2 Tax=Copidosoma floridanum TaxID=29053 RepID=Q2Q1Y6_COPFL|nr:cysteine-rich peptide 2 [Copidosoma floridanum]
MRAVLFALLLVALVAYSSAACDTQMCRAGCSAMGFKSGECAGGMCYCANLVAQQFLTFDMDELAAVFK